jgi:hypothetical protein
MKHDVFVRAKTSDNRWATVNAMDLTDESFKRFVLTKLAEAGIVGAIIDEGDVSLETNLTKLEAER